MSKLPMRCVVIAIDRTLQRRLFSPGALDILRESASVVLPDETGRLTPQSLAPSLRNAEVMVSSWWTPRLDKELLMAAPRLKLVVHAAGSIRPIISDAMWSRGVRVVSEAEALGVGVAEFCLGLILTATKRAFWAGIGTREGHWREGCSVFHGPRELYKQSVGVVGTGAAGRHLIRLLANFDCQVLAYDPYVSADDMAELGAKKVATLDELFERSGVVSINAPTTDETREMIRGRHLRLMPDGALLVNTARAAVVHQAEMIEVLREQRIVACLDVTETEPPAADHPLRALPNVWLTPHEAGAVADNVQRIGDDAIRDVQSYLMGQPIAREVRQTQLGQLA